MAYGRSNSRQFQKRTPRPKSNVLKEAQRKIMDMLATRDHSEKEIRKKLNLRFEAETTDLALEWARTQNWLPSEEKVQTMVIQSLGRRKKGQNAINKKLQEMGLAKVRIEPEIELEKALEAIETKFKKNLFVGLDFKSSMKEKARVLRFLIGRGFDGSTAQKTLNTYFKKAGSTDYDEEF